VRAPCDNFGIMEDGHAGLTFGFDVVDPDGAQLGSYVLKTAPVGVTRRGNTDVFRQAPLIRALKQAGLPVPEIPWASPDEDQLGTPFLVMERMPGRVFLVWEPHASFRATTPEFATSGFRRRGYWRGSIPSIGNGRCPIGRSRNH